MSSHVLQDGLLQSVPTRLGFKVLEPCVLYRKLGEGGIGAVYLARHVKLLTDVAVKCLKPVGGRGADAAVARFRREALLIAEVKHPNLIWIYDVEERYGLHYIVMEYVDGESAEQRVARRGPLSPAEACTVALAVAEGLQAMHDRGVIHRDIKPGNILISKSGKVKLSDLGIAKTEVGVHSFVSEADAIIGTPPYMAPEQFEGASEVVPRTDLYALGATLFYLVTGRNAIDGKSIPQIMRQVIAGFPPPSEWGVDLPPSFQRLVSVATAKDPNQRFSSAGEFATQIRAALDSMGGPVNLTDPHATIANPESVQSVPPSKEIITEIRHSLSEITVTPGVVAQTMTRGGEYVQTIDERAAPIPRTAIATASELARPLSQPSPTRPIPTQPKPASRRGLAVAASLVAILAVSAAAFMFFSRGGDKGLAKPEVESAGEAVDPVGPGAAATLASPGSSMLKQAEASLQAAEWGPMFGHLGEASRQESTQTKPLLELSDRAIQAFRSVSPTQAQQQPIVGPHLADLADLAKRGCDAAARLRAASLASSLPAGDGSAWASLLDQLDRWLTSSQPPADGALATANDVLKGLRSRYPSPELRLSKFPTLPPRLDAWSDKGVVLAGLLWAEHEASSASAPQWAKALTRLQSAATEVGIDRVTDIVPVADFVLGHFYASTPDPSARLTAIPTLEALLDQLQKSGSSWAALLLAEVRTRSQASSRPEGWASVLALVYSARNPNVVPPDEWQQAADRVVSAFHAACGTPESTWSAAFAACKAPLNALADSGVGEASLCLAPAAREAARPGDPASWEPALSRLAQAAVDQRVQATRFAPVADAILRDLRQSVPLAERARSIPQYQQSIEAIDRKAEPNGAGSAFATLLRLESGVTYDEIDRPVVQDLVGFLAQCNEALRRAQRSRAEPDVSEAYFWMGDCLNYLGDRIPLSDRERETVTSGAKTESQVRIDRMLTQYQFGKAANNPNCRLRLAMMELKAASDDSRPVDDHFVSEVESLARAPGTGRALHVLALYAKYGQAKLQGNMTWCELIRLAADKGHLPSVAVLKRDCGADARPATPSPAPGTGVNGTSPRGKDAPPQPATLVDRCKTKEVSELLAPFLAHGYWQPKSQTTSKSRPMSLNELKQSGALSDNDDGLVQLLAVVSHEDNDRPDWEMKWWPASTSDIIKSLTPSQRADLVRAQRELRELGTTLVELGMLSE
ncbi:MAG: protein kinase domain-containing protein [Phycisphaerales bacterium]